VENSVPGCSLIFFLEAAPAPLFFFFLSHEDPKNRGDFELGALVFGPITERFVCWCGLVFLSGWAGKMSEKLF